MTLSEWEIISFKIVSYFIRLLCLKVMNKKIYISTLEELRQSIKTNYIFAAEETINNLRETLRNNREENAFNDQTNPERRKTCKTSFLFDPTYGPNVQLQPKKILSLCYLLPLNFILSFFTNHGLCKSLSANKFNLIFSR